MAQIKLSVIIPCYQDPHLQQTIDALLKRPGLGNGIEIIVMLDGYWPKIPLKNDDRVRVVHLGKNVGPRTCVNMGVQLSRGEFIARADAHCSFSPSWAKTLVESCEPNWIISGERYFLNPETWEIMDKPKVVYEKLVTQTIQDRRKFTGYPWKERDEERKDIMLDETMSIQGAFWMMPRKWWDTIGELDNKYGPHYQDQHEMIFKTWKKGGKAMINKKMWFAHRHNSFSKYHAITHESQKENLQIFYEDWKDYYYQEIKPKWKI